MGKACEVKGPFGEESCSYLDSTRNDLAKIFGRNSSGNDLTKKKSFL